MGGAATTLIHEEAKKYTALDEGLDDRNTAIEEVIRLRKALHQYCGSETINFAVRNGHQAGDAPVLNEINRREPFNAAEILDMSEEELSSHKRRVREAAEKREKKEKARYEQGYKSK